MIYTTDQLKKTHKNFYNVKKLVDEGKYFKVAHGLYSDTNPSLVELECLFAIYPNSVLTMQSAFAFYGLTDLVPDNYYIATKQNAHKVVVDKVVQLYMSEDIFDIGKETIQTKYGTIHIYDKERMLIELFRLKTKFDYSFFKEVVNSYRRLAIDGELDNYKIAKYCSQFSNGLNLRREIEEMVF